MERARSGGRREGRLDVDVRVLGACRRAGAVLARRHSRGGALVNIQRDIEWAMDSGPLDVWGVVFAVVFNLVLVGVILWSRGRSL